MRAAKLKHLCCDNLRIAHVVQPQTVTHLTTNSYNTRIHRFVNLQYLKCTSLNSIHKDLLLFFKNLKELNTFEINRWCVEMYERAYDKVGYLLKQKRVLRRTDFKLYYHGLLITDTKQLDGFDFDLKNTCLLIRNYDRLASDLSFIYQVNYSDLANTVDEIPVDYSRRFFNIQRVETRQVVDPMRFFYFLSGLNVIRSLVLTNSALTQSFYDRLPTLCPGLRWLRITETPELTINLDSILRLKHLKEFTTIMNLEAPFDLVIKSFQTLKCLKEFNFRRDNDKFEISKYSAINYNLTGRWENDRMFFLTAMNFDQLVSHCNRLKG